MQYALWDMTVEYMIMQYALWVMMVEYMMNAVCTVGHDGGVHDVCSMHCGT